MAHAGYGERISGYKLRAKGLYHGRLRALQEYRESRRRLQFLKEEQSESKQRREILDEENLANRLEKYHEHKKAQQVRLNVARAKVRRYKKPSRFLLVKKPVPLSHLFLAPKHRNKKYKKELYDFLLYGKKHPKGRRTKKQNAELMRRLRKMRR